MSFRRLPLLVLAALACLACALPATALAAKKPPKTPKPTPVKPVKGASKAKVGIADQNPFSLADPALAQLKVRYLRRSIGWDWQRFDWQMADIDAWMDQARRLGAEPLITFARSRVHRHKLPTNAQFTAAFKAFRARYPDVKVFSTWNEANHCGEGTCRKPQLVARFYKSIQRNCKGCKVLAADLLDQPNTVAWIRGFKKAAKVEPKYWGLHNYVSANRFDTTRTLEMLRATRGEIWLTETGGLVARRNGSDVKLKAGTKHAAKVTHFIFDKLVRLSPRISRVYLYHWRSSSPRDSWDSAFVGSDGKARPALGVLKGKLRRQAR
jgi:hypothetical protein